MTYTLLKFLGWGILLAVVGGCVGWALRALKARSDLSAARGVAGGADEVEQLRQQLADLEPVVAERDRLRMQIADMRHTDSPGVVGGSVDDEPQAGDDVVSPVADEPTRESDGHDVDGAATADDDR